MQIAEERFFIQLSSLKWEVAKQDGEMEAMIDNSIQLLLSELPFQVECSKR